VRKGRLSEIEKILASGIERSGEKLGETNLNGLANERGRY